MSDRPDLEQARDRVLKALREVERLCRHRPPPQKLFPPLVRIVAQAVNAESGTVWFADGSGRPVMLTGVGAEPAGRNGDDATAAWRGRLVANVIASGEPALERRSVSGSEPEAKSSSGGPPAAVPAVSAFLTAAAAPLFSGRKCVGALEFAFRKDFDASARVSTMEFLEQVAGFASRALDDDTAASGSSGWPAFLERFEGLALTLHRSLDPAVVAAAAANDARSLLGCQRVSVALRRGKRWRVTAISGQEAVNRKSNLVRAMTALIDKVAATGKPVHFSTRSEGVLPSLAGPLTGYLEENGSQVVAIVPLRDHPPRRSQDDESPPGARAEPPRRTVGCLVIDGPVADPLASRSQDAIGLVADHLAAALTNALTYRRLFLLPVWRFLGDRWDRVRRITLLTTLLVAALAAGAVAALVFVPWEYRVPADGRLMPVVQRQVFAPWDGEVVEIHVRDGVRVKANDLLLTLRGSDLQMQILSTRNELNQKQETTLALHAQIDDATKKADRDEETRLQGQLAATRVEIEGLEKQLQSWEERRSQLVVRSPIDGVVATFRVEQLLLNRPVRRGEVLLEVMQDEGAWRLELDVPEHRMGHLLRARRDLSADRPVEFVLATAPETTFSGTLESVGTRTVPTEQQGSVVQSHVKIEQSLLPARNIGAEVKARVACGRRSLGYVLFGDFIEWLRRTLWI